jgi:malonyl-CoA O-methyltransferase
MTQEAPLAVRDHKKTFDSQVHSYDSLAIVQHVSARKLADILQSYSEELGDGPIFELGAGTGMVTDHLIRLFPASTKIVTDISPNMLGLLREKYSRYDNIQYEQHDANHGHRLMDSCRAIVCGFTLQWLDDKVKSVTEWIDALEGPSWVFMTWPGEGSFPEWKGISEKTELEFTGNPLPGAKVVDQIEDISGATLLYHAVEPVELEYPSSVDFFRSMRDIGAGVETEQKDGRRNLLKLSRTWDKLTDGHIKVTYYVHTAVFHKP